MRDREKGFRATSHVCQDAALTSVSPALPASFSRSGLACWALQRSLPAPQEVPRRLTRTPPLQGCSQPAAVAVLEGVSQGMQHTVHVATGRVAAHEADSEDLGGEG